MNKSGTSIAAKLALALKLKEFPELCKEYCLKDNVTFEIPKTLSDYIKVEYNFRLKLVQDVELLKDILVNDSLYDNSFIFSRFIYDENTKGLRHRIILPYHHLEQLVLANTNYINYSLDLDSIHQYLKLVLCHEIGHILHTEDLFQSMDLTKFFKYLENDPNIDELLAYEEYTNQLENDDSIDNKTYCEKSCRAYYQVLNEKMANQFAKIDSEELIRLELLVRRQIKL